MSIAEDIRKKAKSFTELTGLCRTHAICRNLFKEDGNLFVEYIFKDSSNIIKNL